MNKTIIININGIVFHIEEDAYEILKNYMTDVKRHFLNSADSHEITTDIENRLAEMFSEILATENKQVIIEQDVKTVINQMGRVEDFDEIYEDTKSAPNNAFAYNTGERKLFRDPDNHLVSGVCAGIGNYFDVDPIWIRLAFAISFFFAGSGLLLYIILWIVIPKAITRADRMAMQGEKLNLQGFKNNLEGELSAVKNHLGNLQEEARPFVHRSAEMTREFFYHLGVFFQGAGKIIIKLFGILILLAFFAMAIALVVLLVAFIGFGAAHYNHLFPFTIIENDHANRIYVAAFLTAFIPVLVIILLLIRALFNTQSMGKTIGSTIVVVWMCALGTLIFYMAKAGANFRESASFTQDIDLKATPDNVYYLKLNDIKYLTHDDSLRLDIKNHFRNVILTNSDDDEQYSEPRSVYIHIERSDVNKPVLVESFTAKGRDYEDALLNARNVTYIYSQKDSVISLDDMLRRNGNNTWHAEELQLTLKVPLNAKVIIDQELDNRINIDGISVNDCKNDDKHPDATSAAFIMTDDGLQCKIDTTVTDKTTAQIDSTRRAANAKVIAKLQAQVDSARKADGVQKRK